jgi:hypothetical protein
MALWTGYITIVQSAIIHPKNARANTFPAVMFHARIAATAPRQVPSRIHHYCSWEWSHGPVHHAHLQPLCAIRLFPFSEGAPNASRQHSNNSMECNFGHDWIRAAFVFIEIRPLLTTSLCYTAIPFLRRGRISMKTKAALIQS